MDQEIINEKLSERLRTVAAYDGRSLADELEHLFEIEEKIGTEDLRRFPRDARLLTADSTVELPRR